ncbi:HAD-like domain [Pseudocohnilembus persalinus]|uniref:HAD-like domain n=1 Tax=Pseudocohnilembus persalinus TaxID=266149 RepID=A0A0V0QH71_PSEPJ|nr:HAD-like domain [Pseudocohnilembus persalinus]|eukprot:KRX01570.1 HAD-like domain [Pseudocohnilembus persalinus]
MSYLPKTIQDEIFQYNFSGENFIRSLYINFVYEKFLKFVSEELSKNQSVENLGNKILEYYKSDKFNLNEMPPLHIIFMVLLKNTNTNQLLKTQAPIQPFFEQFMITKLKYEDQLELNKTMTVILNGDNQVPNDISQISQFNTAPHNQILSCNNILSNNNIFGNDPHESSMSILENIPQEPIISNEIQNFLLNQSLYPSKQQKQERKILDILLSIKQLYDMIPILYDKNNDVLENEKLNSFTYYISSLMIVANFPQLIDEISIQYKDHYLQSYKLIQYYFEHLENSHSISVKNHQEKKVYLPPLKKQNKNQKTLIFDLDETLIHCNDSIKIPGDTIIEIPIKNTKINNDKSDRELEYLEKFLLDLKNCPDVREYLRNIFQYDQYKHYSLSGQLLQNLYSKF